MKLEKKLSIILLVLLCSLGVFAQFETDYKPVVSKGTLPADFVTLSSQKYEEARHKLGKSEKGSTRKSKEHFLLESNYSIDNILLSGKVVFNDPMADYVNKVADKALESEPQLRQELRFYIFKSSSVNAFATNQGVVFVTMGLLAQLENEAQLAFILCHEAVHYKQKHAIEKYLEAENIKKGKGAYRQLSFDEKTIAKCAFNKEQEKEADAKGMEIYLKSKYATLNLIGVYDVLKYAYLPFDDVEFDKSFLENNTLKFPDGYLIKNTQQVDTRDIDDDDKRSTHPSIAFRRYETTLAIKGIDNSQRTNYQVGEKDFKNVREIARFELCRLYTLHRRYESGLYTSYLLLKKYPNNLYLKKNVAFCLGGLAQYSNEWKFTDVHYNSDSVEGKSQALFYLMWRLDSARADLNIVALAYTTKLKVEYPKDPEIEQLYKSQLNSLVTTYNKHYSDFSTLSLEAEQALAIAAAQQKPEPKIDTTIVAAISTEGEKSKYDKLREQKVVEEHTVDTSAPFTRYAFVEYMDKDWFKRDFANAEDSGTQAVSEDINYSSRYRYWDHTYALGVNKIVVVDPYFARINAKKKEKFKYIESEYGQVDFAERLKKNAKKAKLGIEVLNTKNLDASETDKLNDVAVMEEYITERLAHEKGINLPYAERQRILALADKYGTDYFMWTGNVSLTDKNRMRAFWLFYSIILPPVLPFTLPSIINGGQYTLYFALVYNVRTDELKMSTFREIQNRTKGYIVNSHVYDVFNQVKSTKK